MRSLTVLAAVAIAAATTVLTSCDDVDEGAAAERLETSRVDLMEAGRSLADGLATDVAGTVAEAGGGFEGCAEDFGDTISSFEYVVSVRVDRGSGAETTVEDAVPARLTEIGFDQPQVSEPPGGGDQWSTSKGDLSAAVVQRTGTDWLILRLSGPCVDVGSDADAWSARDTDEL